MFYELSWTHCTMEAGRRKEYSQIWGSHFSSARRTLYKHISVGRHFSISFLQILCLCLCQDYLAKTICIASSLEKQRWCLPLQQSSALFPDLYNTKNVVSGQRLGRFSSSILIKWGFLKMWHTPISCVAFIWAHLLMTLVGLRGNGSPSS